MSPDLRIAPVADFTRFFGRQVGCRHSHMSQFILNHQQTSPQSNNLPRTFQAYLLRWAEAWPQIEKIILFGSRARGDAAARADIDLAIMAPTATLRQWLDIVAEVADAPTLLSIDLVRWEEAPPALRGQIAAEGKVVYERRQTDPEPE